MRCIALEQKPVKKAAIFIFSPFGAREGAEFLRALSSQPFYRYETPDERRRAVFDCMDVRAGDLDVTFYSFFSNQTVISFLPAFHRLVSEGVQAIGMIFLVSEAVYVSRADYIYSHIYRFNRGAPAPIGLEWDGSIKYYPNFSLLPVTDFVFTFRETGVDMPRLLAVLKNEREPRISLSEIRRLTLNNTKVPILRYDPSDAGSIQRLVLDFLYTLPASDTTRQIISFLKKAQREGKK